MYGLSPETNLNFLLEQRLIQACFGASALILKFDGIEPVTITVASSIACISFDDLDVPTEDFASRAGFVLGLVDHRVKSASVHGTGTLQIEFGTGLKLQILDHSERFQSYTIQYQGRIIFV